MIIEINGRKADAQKNYSAGLWNEWTPERIRGAFNFGNGTYKDLIRYARDNKQYCCLYDTERKCFIA